MEANGSGKLSVDAAELPTALRLFLPSSDGFRAGHTLS